MKLNLDHIWLPYTQHGLNPKPLHIVDAKGCVLKTADGRQLIDGISSWWTACHGYKHPHLVKAVQTQAEKLSHIMFAGLAHDEAYRLAKRLAKLTGLPRVFFSDSGSTAVEVAMKISVQYWRNQSKSTRRLRFVCFSHSYHGDTMGAMSVSDHGGMHSPYAGYMPKQFTVDLPADERGLDKFAGFLKNHKNEVAAVIIEPLVQGAGGMKFHSPKILAEIYRITKRNGILFIADEIATGFGRTGSMFACEQAKITPDIMCVGKGLTGGMLGLAATCASAEVFEKFLSDKHENALMHGPTYMANPLACAAANASLDLFEREPRLKQVAKIESIMNKALAKCKKLPIVKDVRVKGAFGVVQLNSNNKEEDNQLIWELRKKFVAEGVWLRPFGDIVYLAPPFVISEKELKILTNAIFKVLAGIK